MLQTTLTTNHSLTPAADSVIPWQELYDECQATTENLERLLAQTFVECEQFRQQAAQDEIQLRNECQELHTQLQAAQHKLREVEQSRDQIQRQHDQLQTRSHELHEELQARKRQHASDQETWQNELRQLRKLIEKQLHQSSKQQEVTSSEQGHASESVGAANKAEPALDAVLNQFQTIQHDLAKRRGSR